MKKIYSSSDKARLTLILTTMMIVAFCIVGRIDVTEGEDGEPTFTNLPLTLEALYIMMEGEAKEYDKQYEERMERLSMSDPKVTLKAFTAKPSLLFHSDLDLNKKHWKNRYVARYYNKKFVVLIEE